MNEEILEINEVCPGTPEAVRVILTKEGTQFVIWAEEVECSRIISPRRHFLNESEARGEFEFLVTSLANTLGEV